MKAPLVCLKDGCDGSLVLPMPKGTLRAYLGEPIQCQAAECAICGAKYFVELQDGGEE